LYVEYTSGISFFYFSCIIFVFIIFQLKKIGLNPLSYLYAILSNVYVYFGGWKFNDSSSKNHIYLWSPWFLCYQNEIYKTPIILMLFDFKNISPQNLLIALKLCWTEPPCLSKTYLVLANITTNFHHLSIKTY
jgi:hypothetical protein